MAYVDYAYSSLSLSILEKGYFYLDESRDKRCKQISSAFLDIPLGNYGFPLLTTKQMFTKGIVGELLWFLRGDSNIKYLTDNGITIWNKDANNYSNNGDVGRNYGVQWRDWTRFCDDKESCCTDSLDQIFNLVQNLKNKPMGRRHIVTAWNPAELNMTALPPCHWAFEIIPRPLQDFEKDLFETESQYGFDLKWHQRSVDTFLGLPFNIASYALLSKILEKITGYVALGIIGDLSNVHFYEPHIEIVKEQLSRDIFKYPDCELKFSENAEKLFLEYHKGRLVLDELFKSLKIEDFIFENYQSFGPLKAEMYEPINDKN